MNELDRIKKDVNKLAVCIYELKMLNLYPIDELETIENKGLKEICDRSKHTMEDIVYTTHKETIEGF